MRGRTTFTSSRTGFLLFGAPIRILVIEQGRRAISSSEGRTPNFCSRHSRYWEMYTRQHALDENLFLAPGEGDSMPGTGIFRTATRALRARDPVS